MEPKPAATPPAELHYEPKPPKLRRVFRRRNLLRILLVACLAAATWVGVRRGPEWWYEASHRYWESRCLAYQLPPETVVFETDPTAAARLLKNSDYFAYPTTMPGSPPIAARHVPRCALEALYRGSATEVTLPPPDAFLFVHKLTSSTGVSRVVIVSLTLNDFPVPDRVRNPPILLGAVPHRMELADYVDARDIRTRSFQWDWTHRNVMTDSCFGLWQALNDRTLRLYAGQADPTDPSRFSIGYEIRGERGTIDGQLLDPDVPQGGLFSSQRRDWVVKWSVRDGPAKGAFTRETVADQAGGQESAAPDQQYTGSVVAGTVTGFGLVDDPGRADPVVVCRVTIARVYTGRKDWVGKSFAADTRLAYYEGEPGPPMLRLGDEGTWTVESRQDPTDGENRSEQLWASVCHGTKLQEGPQEYGFVRGLAEVMEQDAALAPDARFEMLKRWVRDANPRVAAWAVWEIQYIKSPAAIDYLEQIAGDDLCTAAQLAIDDVMTRGQQRGDSWRRSSARAALLRRLGSRALTAGETESLREAMHSHDGALGAAIDRALGRVATTRPAK
jgi:hypothetical protein